MFLNLSFKMAASFTNVARTVSGQLPQGKIAPRLGLGFGLGLELELGSGGKNFPYKTHCKVSSLFLIWCDRLPIYDNLK